MSILEISADDYHVDFLGPWAAGPTLSASIANVLIAQSPAHARAAHPKLNPHYKPKHEEKFDIGTVAHALLLEGQAAVDILEFPDWRSGAAKDARELSRQHGRIPLLGKHYDDVTAMVDAVRSQLDALTVTPPLFTAGKPEQTIVWEDNGVLCRARLDWLHNDLTAYDDLKTTSASAHPERWQRTLYGIGADVKAAFYMRGIKAVTGAEPVFRWVVVETYPPFALSVVSLAPSGWALANDKVDRALALWKQCLAEDSWPAYPAAVAHVEAPSWEMSRWLEREAREDVAA